MARGRTKATDPTKTQPLSWISSDALPGHFEGREDNPRILTAKLGPTRPAQLIGEVEMGVSIHYRGRLDNKDRLPALRNTLIGIASSIGWQCRILDEDWNVPANAVLVHRGETAEIKGHLGLRGLRRSEGSFFRRRQETPPQASKPAKYRRIVNGFGTA
jgi:hypothetical protein